MLLFWKVRYLDSADKGFKDRELWLDTDSLDPVTRAAVEATYALKDAGRKRDMLRYRHLFHGKRLTDEEVQVASRKSNGWDIVFIVDYFEDEAGQELTHKGMAVTLTGDPQAILFPPGTKQHEIEYCLAEDRTIDLDQVKLTQDQLNVLGTLRGTSASCSHPRSARTVRAPCNCPDRSVGTRWRPPPRMRRYGRSSPSSAGCTWAGSRPTSLKAPRSSRRPSMGIPWQTWSKAS